MKTHQLVAATDTVEEFRVTMQTLGLFEIHMPWDANKEYPESGDLLAIHAFNHPVTVFAWVRTVEPGDIDQQTRIRKLKMTAGKRLRVGARLLPAPKTSTPRKGV